MTWATEVAGVESAFVFPGWMGPGTVGLTFLTENQGIPTQPKLDEVYDYILDDRKNVTAELYVFAPQVLTVDITIRVRPNTAEIRSAAEAELADLFFRESKPAGSYLNSKELNTGRIALSKISEAISTVPGVADHVVITPTTNIQPTNGAIAKLGTVTWQTLA